MRGEQYLTKPGQYARVYKTGSARVNRLVVMKAVPNSLIISRYGISAVFRSMFGGGSGLDGAGGAAALGAVGAGATVVGV